MEKYVERMMQEHQQLVEKRRKLNDFLKSDKAKEIDRDEYALMCVQEVAMHEYERCLDDRLEMHNVSYNGQDAYYQQIQVPNEKIEVNIIQCNHCGQDVDKNKATESK